MNDSRTSSENPRLDSGPTLLACPICESRNRGDYTIVGNAARPGDYGVEEFLILQCRRHGVEFADALPVSPGPVELQSLDAMYGTATDPRSGSRYEDFMNRIDQVVRARRGAILHDVGCGNGQLLIEARRRGWNVQGNDIVPEVKDRIEREDITCLIGSLHELAITSEMCDVVTSFCVLPHHLTDPDPDMRAALRILRPGGWLVIQLPINGVYRRVAKAIHSLCWPGRPTRLGRRALAEICAPGGHQFAYTSQNHKEYLLKCGFVDVMVAPYSVSPRYTLARFAWEPACLRRTAFIAVHAMRCASHILGLPNSAIVFARKPRVSHT